MSDLYDECPDGTYLDYPMMCSGRITKEAKMDEKIGEIEKAWRDGFGIELNNDDLGKMFLHIKELEGRIELAEATRDDALAYAKMYKEKVKELEGERFYWNCPIHGETKNAWGCPECIVELRARVKELTEGIEGILNQKDLISFAIQKQLEGLMVGKEKP